MMANRDRQIEVVTQETQMREKMKRHGGLPADSRQWCTAKREMGRRERRWRERRREELG